MSSSSASNFQSSQNSNSERTPQQKRRRNESGVWRYINKVSRKCEVELCTKEFSKNTSTTTLIYHLHSDHDITIIEENNDDINNGRNELNKDKEDDEDEFDTPRRFATKHGTKIQREIDSLLLVITSIL